MYKLNFRGAAAGNYKLGRAKPIEYIVIHYTANNGDTAAGNANYFSNTITGASAHYFVDESPDIWQTVHDEHTAWHCGTTGVYRHPACRNDNSIGIELCSRKDGLGRYYFKADTVSNAAALAGELMDKYNIPLINVLRHYDVTGKCCPAPFVEDEALWRDFIGRLKPKPEPKPTVEFDLFGEQKVSVRGRIIDGVTHVEARQLLEALGYTVDWNDAAKAVVVQYKLPRQITVEELTILEKIVEAEAGGEDDTGKMLVVSVIWNRLKDKQFPNSITEVVFQPNQFEPTRNGAYERVAPSLNTKQAVQKALHIDLSQGALFFRSVNGLTPDCWHETALEFLFEHGGHRFYK